MTNKYLIDENEEKSLFNNALIIFDTSSLLDFYYYSSKTQNEIFETVFKKIENRMWLPYQVFYEFQKNRDKVMMKPIETYQSLLSKNKDNKDSGHFDEMHSIIKKFKTEQIANVKGHLKTLVEKTHKDDKHPFFEDKYFDHLEKRINLLDEYLSKTDDEFKNFKKLLEKDIKKKIKQIEKIKSSDSVYDSFKENFAIGEEWNYDELLAITKEGEFRYRNEIPPGFEDFDEKSGFQKYGDLILWKQLLKYANVNGKPVIFVTNDNKKDWWYFDGNINTKSPRHELISEFSSNNEQKFWMYNSNDFLYKIKKILDLEIEDSSIEEVKEVYESHSTSNKDTILGDWLAKKHKFRMFITFDGKEKDNGLDFLCINDEGIKQGFETKRAITSNYASIFGNLKKSILNKGEVISKNSLDRFTHIIEGKNKASATKIARHLVRANPRKVLRENENDFGVIVGYFDKSRKQFIATFESDKLK